MLEKMGKAARAAAYKLADLSTAEKTRCCSPSPIASIRSAM